MSTPVNTYFWSTVNTVVTSQLNEGPFIINPMSKLLEVTVKGQLNVQSSVVGSPVTGNNDLSWAIFWVPHGGSILNIVGGSDGRQFLVREQLGDTDNFVAWAPSTSNGVLFGAFGLDRVWRGQQLTGGGIDLYVSFATPLSGGVGNVISNGTLRARAV